MNSDRVPSGWAASLRGRRELLLVAAFATAFVVVPLFVTDLFPFSQAPMFADAPRQCCNYTVYLPDGQQSPPDRLKDVGLQRNYWGNPVGVGTGFLPPTSVDVFGEVATEAEVRKVVEEHLRERPELPFVDVVQEVIGALDDQRAGIRETHRWHIENPALRRPRQ
jgi:hypothetical protein